MTAELGYIILAEVVFALFVIWGFLHEDRFIRFEEMLGKIVRRLFFRRKRAVKKLRVIRGRVAQKGPGRSAA
ncbi:MAG: hypothetical protein IJL25_01120 [Clostridia bacterium]|nr:hypothetical protein [Clostridia bacterium]MBR5424191.1 hypothetical protein [Clostridia bacterium]